MHKKSANAKKPFLKNQLCWDMLCRAKFNYFIYFNLILFSLGRGYTTIATLIFLKNFDVAMNASVDVSIQAFCAFFVYIFLLLSGVEFLGHIFRIQLYSYYFAWLLWSLIFLLFELSFLVQIIENYTNENRGNHQDACHIESRLRYICFCPLYQTSTQRFTKALLFIVCRIAMK